MRMRYFCQQQLQLSAQSPFRNSSIVFHRSSTPTTTAAMRIWNRRLATNDDSLANDSFVEQLQYSSNTVAFNSASHGNSAAIETLRNYIKQIKNHPNYNTKYSEKEYTATTITVADSTHTTTTSTGTTAGTVASEYFASTSTTATAKKLATTKGTTTTTLTTKTPRIVFTKPNTPQLERSKSQVSISLLQTAKKLLQAPVGTFKYPTDYISSRKYVSYICIQVHNNSKQTHDLLSDSKTSFFISAINTAIQVLERNVEEYALRMQSRQLNSTNGTHHHIKNSVAWFHDVKLLNALFSRWKYLVLPFTVHPNKIITMDMNPTGRNTERPELVSAHDLIQRIERMSSLLPSQFHCDIATANMILTVLVRQAASKQEVPIIAERLLSRAKINTDDKSRIRPTSHVYAIVMKAWVDSGLPETCSKIDALLHEFQTIIGLMDSSSNDDGSIQRGDDLVETSFHANDHHHHVSTRWIPHSIAMQYYALRLKNFKKVQAMLMSSNNIIKQHFNPSTSCEFLSLALYCAVQCHEVEYMGYIFQRLTEALTTTDEHNSKLYKVQHESFLVGAGHLLHYYCCQIRKAVDNNTYRNIHQRQDDSTTTINEYIDRGQNVWQLVERFCSPSAGQSPSYMRISCTMMEIFGYAKRIDLVNDIFHKMVAPNREAHDMLIKAYGNCHLPDRAEEIFRKMFTKESRVKPGIKTINLYMNCWVESMMLSSDDIDKTAMEKVYHTFHWMKTDKQCTNLNIQPDTYTYFVILRGEVASATAASKLCVSTLDRMNGINSSLQINSSIVDKVGEILKEMEDRYKSGDRRCKPNVPIYNCAMKALILANDYLRAEQILYRMEESIYRNNVTLQDATATDVVSNVWIHAILRPNVHTYILFFNFYTRMRSTDGATRSEQLHNHMRNLSIEMADEDIKPNSITYKKVLDAWVASGDTNVTTDLWRIYEQMSKVDDITIEYDTYMALIKSISKSNRDLDKRRLMELLQHMNDHPTADMDGSLHIIALENCMSSGDVTTTTLVMKAIVDSYVHGHFTIVPPDRSTFNWILTTYLASNDLKSATLFVQDIVQIKNDSKHDSSGNELDVSWIGPDFNLILDLRKAWEEDTKDAAKNHFTSKLDIDLMPTMV